MRLLRTSPGIAAVTVLALALLAAAGVAGYTRGAHDQAAAAAREARGHEARYLAEAALQHAVWQLKREPNWRGTISSALEGRAYRAEVQETAQAMEPLVLTQAALEDDGRAGRALEAQTRIRYYPLFFVAARGEAEVEINGDSLTDSFDSRGADPGAPLGRGHVGAPSVVKVTGSSTVHGDVFLAEGGRLILASGSEVGDVHVLDEIPPLPAVTLPTEGTRLGALDLSAQESYRFAAGTYLLDALTSTGGATIAIDGDVTLAVNGPVELAGTGRIVLAEGARLRLVVAGTLDVYGHMALNPDGQSDQLSIEQTPPQGRCSGDARIFGDALVRGTISASGRTLGVDGHATVAGAAAARKVRALGNARILFDEALLDVGPDDVLRGVRVQILRFREVEYR